MVSTMTNDTLHRKQLQSQLSQARTRAEWEAAAHKLDELDDLLAWREQANTDLLHTTLIEEHMNDMRLCREQGDTRALTRVLQESLYRHLGELANPDLYAVARTGTKYLVTRFLDEVERSMDFICDHPMAGATEEQKLQLFLQAEKVYGQPALMLSGGAAFGVFHLGVARALWEQDLLPDIIAGSSMGAIVAGTLCNRNEKELKRFFSHPEKLHTEAFRWLSVEQVWLRRHTMDQHQLLEHIRANVGSASFREAYRHSGRILNISVSPTRTRQKPRLLNQLSAPDVMIDSAILASCAVPAIYPPVILKARTLKRDADAEIEYMPTERWIDGSVHGDMPLMRLARLHNVNRTIVSQANPHVLPFISHHQRRGSFATLRQATAVFAHGQVATMLELSRSSWTPALVRPFLEQAHALATQSYLGDINIQFPFRPLLYRKVLSNPDPEDMEAFIRMGERATWPQLAMIRDQTRISRTFSRCIARLRERAAAEQQAAC